MTTRRSGHSRFRPGHHDENHAGLAAFLSRLGPEPIDLSRIGKGCPDLLWPFQGQTLLLEIKGEDGNLSPSQQRFIDEWRGGPLFVVRTEEDVMRAIRRVQQGTTLRQRVIG